MKKLIFTLTLAIFLTACSKTEQPQIQQQGAAAYIVDYSGNEKAIKITADLQGQYFLESIADLKGSDEVCLIRIQKGDLRKQAYAYDLKRDDSGYFVLAEDISKETGQRKTVTPEKGDAIFADKQCRDLVDR